MSKNYELDGIGNSFEVGVGGGRIKNVSGELQVRNNADSGFGQLQVADGVDDQDAVNKSQLDAVISSQMNVASANFTFESTSPFNIGSALPANSIVLKAIVNVDTAFDGTTPTLEIGVTGNTTAIHSDVSTDLTDNDLYISDEYYDVGASAAQIIGTLSVTSATAGSGKIILLYHTVT